MLNQIYNYQKLSRVEENGTRRYRLDGSGDSPVPSVTTILDALKDKTHLYEWRKRVGNAEATRITTMSANIGTATHLNIEKHVLDEERPDGTNLVHQMARGLSDVVIDEGLSNVSEVWGTEVPVYYPDLYAGTTDCVGLWKGHQSIIDFKTTRKPKKKEWIEDYFYQGAAYAMAHNHAFGTNIDHIVIMMVAWDEGYEGVYQEFVVEGDEFAHYSTGWAYKVKEYHEKFM